MNKKIILSPLIGLFLLFSGVNQPLAEPKLTPLSPSQKAIDFNLPDLEGRIHQLSDYQGQVVLVNFWATWCPPCRKEMPSLMRLDRELKEQGFTILAIDVGEERETIQSFLKQYSLNFPILMDPTTQWAKKWSVRGLPTTFLLDNNANILYQAQGGLEWDSPSIVKVIKTLLDTKE
jgi:thiol-disulfide isomerase/thioredoxin